MDEGRVSVKKALFFLFLTSPLSAQVIPGGVSSTSGHFTSSVTASAFIGNGSQLTNLPTTAPTTWIFPYGIHTSTIVATSSVTASSFYGDGSHLTGISAGNGGYAVQPATVTFQLNQGLSSSYGSFSSSISVPTVFTSPSGVPNYSFSSSTGTGLGLIAQSSPTIFVNGTPFISAGFGDIFNSTFPHVWIGGGPITGTLQPQPSEILTVYGEGGYPSSTYVDILSLNTGTNDGARVGGYAYGGGGENATAAFIGATGAHNHTFGWGGGPSFQHSPFIDMQSSNASIYSGGGPMYFHQHTASAGFYFVKSNGHYDAAFEDGDLRLYPNGGVTGVNGNILIHAQSTPASDAVMKIQNAPLALSRTYTIPEAGQNATFIMSESTNTIGIHARVSISSQMAAVGTGTNDDAPATYIGEYISTSVTSGNANSSTGSGQYFDICAMNLSPGDWDVSGIIVFTGGTQQGGSGGITTTAGNFSTGAIMGTNFLWILPGNATVDNGTSIPDVRASIASITTYYLKANITYSAGTAKAYGRLSARRRR